MISGKVGAETDQQGGYDAARQTGLAILATLRANLGSLDRVKRVIKTLGMVNSTAEFAAMPRGVEVFRRQTDADCVAGLVEGWNRAVGRVM
jgi:enamine deaminase RidA (YjgF/YER057c/UK114 family)